MLIGILCDADSIELCTILALLLARPSPAHFSSAQKRIRETKGRSQADQRWEANPAVN
jgi:hypothetical protein